MQPNVAIADDTPPQIKILDDTLINYGFEPGTIVPLQTGAQEHGAVPVWELDGKLQARLIKDEGNGWATAWTSFLSAGKICYSLSPEKVARVKQVGWIGIRG
jgi:hypothetical protein